MIRAAVRQFFVKHGIAPGRVAVAVSGGTDSTALLLTMAELREEGFDVLAAHVNHHLRGADSDADEAFVRDLCARLGVPLQVLDGSLDPGAIRDRGIEAAAREVRYARLLSLGVPHIATAHQKNDQAETVLMRLLTGSGLAGLRGIHPFRQDGIIRPLLDVTRAELEAFLRERAITPRQDRSNDDPRFLRNRLRPLLRDLGATDNLAALATQAQAQWPLIERAITETERDSVEITSDETHFIHPIEDPWLRQALLHRHIRRLDSQARDVSAADLARLASELEAIHRVSVTKTLELVRKGPTLILRKRPEPTPDFELTLTPDHPTYIPELSVTIHVTINHQPSTITPASNQQPATSNQLLQLPQNATPQFTIRNRRPGDRFQPLGMANPKKLKDFLIDRKIAAEVRDRLPLLLWNDEIVWIAGVEVSERFKVTSRLDAAELNPPGGVLYEVWMEGSV